MSSCGTANSFFLKRIIPLYRLGKSPDLPSNLFAKATATTTASPSQPAAAAVTDDENHPIDYKSPEWQRAMCLLYRNLLRLHQFYIPNEVQRTFGDRFIANEFRRGKELSEKNALKFYQGWVEYGVMIERGAAQQGRSMSDKQLDSLSEDQKGNLKEFRTKVFEARTQEDADVPGGAKKV